MLPLIVSSQRCLYETRIDSPLAAYCLIFYPPLYTTNTMEEGTVARVVSDKGFGFIKRDGQEKDLFFHSNELVNTTFNEIREGDKVTFEVADSPKGPNAIKVSKI